ncbi:MAG TPA: hypothetical protein VFH16_16545 [Rubrobacter sp.]|nr:hypothetical protein [Rubrobacter sp.]
MLSLMLSVLSPSLKLDMRLEQEVVERSKHATAESVRTTCSFARAERLLGREYHGRFLIELLQNAADASRSAQSSPGRSSVVVQNTEGPALLVANQGAPMSAEVVIESLGHIGASTKASGMTFGELARFDYSYVEVGTRRPAHELADPLVAESAAAPAPDVELQVLGAEESVTIEWEVCS